eukprot:CAMPEP_0196827312 /NCGR_PEP_ID=MMETSP1362-20130617/94092_1 /TAXON_ID=163516 /ORGANISM="Leptocylindrus danicus, Strain CCMP1856" /LENGTH=474 /DNA_ID=CAMNT_0042207941 /DNA_START=610 /DNA_END=2031 /DNA_ORIENTATION=+
MMEVDNDGNPATQIRISLQLYRGCDESLEVPSLPMAVPANLKRKGLASIVNHLLGRTDTDKQDNEDEDEESTSSTASGNDNKLAPLPFDFLIQKTNRLLRTSLENAVRSSGLSTEEDLLISYFPAVKPPQTGDDTEPLPDWVSAIAFSSNFFMSGAYDGILRVHDVSSGAVSSQVQAHDGPIKCMSVHPYTGNSNVVANSNDIMIATGSGDHTLVTHIYNCAENKLRLNAEYTGTHTNGIEAARFNSAGNTLASADWNGNVALWQVPDIINTNDNSEGQSKKKSKRAKEDFTGTDSSSNNVTAGVTWKAHSSNVSGVVWSLDNKHLITGSWDHSVKTWDAERQDCLLTLNGARVVTTLDRCSNSDIIATGHPDSAVRLWDMRVGGAKEQAKVLDASLKVSHKAWISAVEWSPIEPHMLATTSHDGLIKMWDIRSTLPLHSVRAHKKGEKGLCVTLGENIAFSGGSDCMIKKFTW